MNKITAILMYEIVSKHSQITLSELRKSIDNRYSKTHTHEIKTNILNDIVKYSKANITAEDYAGYQQQSIKQKNLFDESYGAFLYCLIYGNSKEICYKDFVNSNSAISKVSMYRKYKIANQRLAGFYYDAILKTNPLEQEEKTQAIENNLIGNSEQKELLSKIDRLESLLQQAISQGVVLNPLTNTQPEIKSEKVVIENISTAQNVETKKAELVNKIEKPSVEIATSKMDVAPNSEFKEQYRQRVLRELEEIDRNPNRLPLYPNDLEHPYKQELWYKFDELRISNPDELYEQREENGEERLTVSHGSHMFFAVKSNNVELFSQFDIFGMRYCDDSFLPDICKEAKKGSATRGWISHHVRYLIDKIIKLGLEKNEHYLQEYVDEILLEWELDPIKARILIPSYGWKRNHHEISKYDNWRDLLEKSKEEIIDTIYKFDDYVLRDMRERGEEKEFQKKVLAGVLGMKDRNEISEYYSSIRYSKKFSPRDANYLKIRQNQFHYTLKYNTAVGRSKLEFLKERIYDKYGLNETTINLAKRDLMISYLHEDISCKFYENYRRIKI